MLFYKITDMPDPKKHPLPNQPERNDPTRKEPNPDPSRKVPERNDPTRIDEPGKVDPTRIPQTPPKPSSQPGWPNP
jgi:hypothetical protein